MINKTLIVNFLQIYRLIVRIQGNLYSLFTNEASTASIKLGGQYRLCDRERLIFRKYSRRWLVKSLILSLSTTWKGFKNWNFWPIPACTVIRFRKYLWLVICQGLGSPVWIWPWRGWYRNRRKSNKITSPKFWAHALSWTLLWVFRRYLRLLKAFWTKKRDQKST